MPTIAIDARKYSDFGIGIYIQNLVSSLSGLNTSHRFVLYVPVADRGKVTLPANWEERGTRYGKYSAGEFMLYGRQIRSEEVDLFHEPHYTLPLGLRGRSVVTIHDLIHLKLPQYFTSLQRGYARMMIGHAVRNAGAVIAVSTKTKEDIVEMFRVREERVTVIHNGINASFQRLEEAVIRQFRQELGLRCPYVLFVGNVKPHKNVATLLKAFSRLRQRYPDLRLVFAGGKCFGDQSLSLLARELRIVDYILDLGQIEGRELLGVYNAAEMLILPSYYEGFGFPVLEAMACGVPTVISNGGSLPEVAGDASMICDPFEPDSFVQAMETLLTDSSRRTELVSRGKERVSHFSWQEAAKQTLNAYERVLKECHVS
jgi:glycosyltransferase involved in cell wall biosynthesis